MPKPLPSTRSQDFGIGIEGLTEFRNALKHISGEIPKMLRDELKEAGRAAEFAAVRNYSRRFTSRSGKTINSIKLRATPTSVALAFGGPRFAWVKGQEFGSNKWSLRQFAPWTGRLGRGSKGRVVWPAVREEGEQMIEELHDRLNKVARRAYPDP